MIKNTLVALMMSVAVSQASIQELVPNLSSSDLDVQNKARFALFDACSNAGRPGAEGERKAMSEEVCRVLSKGLPLSAMRPMIYNLERIGAAEAVPTLAKLLNHKNEHVRDDARRALAVNPSEDAAKALGAQLKMRKARNARETAGLIQALGERHEAGVENLIVVHLGSKDDQIFIASVKALGRIGNDGAIRALAEQRSMAKGFRLTQINAALFSTDRAVVFQKLYAESEPIEVRAVALQGLVMNKGFSAASDAMGSGNPALQAAVIEGTLQCKNPKLYSLLAANLKTLSPALQVQAMGVLEFSGINTYAQSVEPMLAPSNDVTVQDAAAQALARIGTGKSVAPLLSSGTYQSLRALGMLNADGVDKMLEKEAAPGKDGNRRSAAIDALGNRGRKDLIPQLFKYAEESSERVSKSAIKAIGAIGDLSNLEELIKLMIAREKDRVSKDILNASVEIMRRSTEQSKAVGILVAQIDGVSPRSQANILQALVQTESTEAIAPLVTAAKSNDEQLQKTAIKLLGGWKRDNGIPAMLELAADESISLGNHVVLMRGVSRLLAGQRRLDKEQANQALETCRRDEERSAIQATVDKAK